VSDEPAIHPEGPIEVKPSAGARGGLPGPLRVGSVVVSPLLFLPRLALGALVDIRAIARSTAELPEVRRQLSEIEEHIQSVDREVLRMRQGVDSVGEEVVKLRGDVRPITGAAARLGRLRRRRPASPDS
jgi:hypothetical protein